MYRNSKHEPSPVAVYKKRINGDFYVVEAIPDSKTKALQIVSAYTGKAESESGRVLDAKQAPSFYARNDAARTHLQIIPQTESQSQQVYASNPDAKNTATPGGQPLTGIQSIDIKTLSEDAVKTKQNSFEYNGETYHRRRTSKELVREADMTRRTMLLDEKAYQDFWGLSSNEAMRIERGRRADIEKAKGNSAKVAEINTKYDAQIDEKIAKHTRRMSGQSGFIFPEMLGVNKIAPNITDRKNKLHFASIPPVSQLLIISILSTFWVPSRPSSRLCCERILILRLNFVKLQCLYYWNRTNEQSYRLLGQDFD